MLRVLTASAKPERLQHEMQLAWCKKEIFGGLCGRKVNMSFRLSYLDEVWLHYRRLKLTFSSR